MAVTKVILKKLKEFDDDLRYKICSEAHRRGFDSFILQPLPIYNMLYIFQGSENFSLRNRLEKQFRMDQIFKFFYDELVFILNFLSYHLLISSDFAFF